MVERHSLSSLLTSLLLCLTTVVCAQRHEVMAPNISGLQVVAEGRWMELPIIDLSRGEQVTISFDDRTHEDIRYIYKVEHCDADWSVSEGIFDTDWLQGFSSMQLPDPEESLNTTVLYNHYEFTLPNDDTQLKLSGNYRVSIIDEETGECVMRTCFLALEPIMPCGISYRVDTDTEVRRSKQQIEANVNFGPLRVTDTERQIHTVFLQNHRWSNARFSPRPDYQTGNGLRWDHQRELIFDAGNTYRKFEILDMQHPTMGIDFMDWDGERYHATPYMAEPRLNYTYDEAPQGAFLLRNSDNYNSSTESDYALVHFYLKTSIPADGSRIFLNGAWTNDRLKPEYEMHRNPETGNYEATTELKQGYYSYQYLLQRPDGSIGPLPSEGNFYETRNSYQMLVYYRDQVGRTDLLVGYATTK